MFKLLNCLKIFCLKFDVHLNKKHIISKAAGKELVTLFKSNSIFKFSEEDFLKLPQNFLFFPYAFTHHWKATAKENFHKVKLKEKQQHYRFS